MSAHTHTPMQRSLTNDSHCHGLSTLYQQDLHEPFETELEKELSTTHLCITIRWSGRPPAAAADAARARATEMSLAGWSRC